ncbi:toxin-antitoxin system, toxin component [Streptomyces nanshensis]|nr:toxin-antitoxin system, toxin component [Streptomyces nanshensis]
MSMSGIYWYKSSYSTAQGDNCIEVAVAQQAVHVRDSKDLARPAFTVGHEGWGRFVSYAAHGRARGAGSVPTASPN